MELTTASLAMRPVSRATAACQTPKPMGLIVFGLYLLGPVMAILSGLILKRSVFQGEPAPFLLELPPYRMPTLKNAARRGPGLSS